MRKKKQINIEESEVMKITKQIDKLITKFINDSGGYNSVDFKKIITNEVKSLQEIRDYLIENEGK